VPREAGGLERFLNRPGQTEAVDSFIVRVFRGFYPGRPEDLRGIVRHVASGDESIFQNLPALERFLRAAHPPTPPPHVRHRRRRSRGRIHP
jgi:hypothetical protein